MRKLLLSVPIILMACNGPHEKVIHDTIRVIHDTVVVNKKKVIQHDIEPREQRRPYKRLQAIQDSTCCEGGPVREMPQTALKINFECKHIFILKEYVLTGTITNISEQWNYKDAVIAVKQYSATGTVVNAETYPVYRFFNQGIATPFKLEVNKIDGSEYATCEIYDATKVNQ